MEKLISHLKWFFAVVPIGIIAMITSPVIYPLAYIIELIFPKFNPLWWWLDDEIEDEKTNKDWLIYSNNEINNFKHLYQWHAFRNSMWNLKNLIKPESARVNCISNNEVIQEVLIDNLYRDGEKVSIYKDCIEMAGFKWIDKYGNEGWQVHSGIQISKRFSTIGTSALWYTANGKLYYRYSRATELNIFRKAYYFEFKMGASEKRYLFTFKLKKA